MKFKTAWADVAAQNLTLKVAVASLSLTTAVLAGTTIKLSMKNLPIIDRGCITQALNPAPNDHTKSEIEEFLRKAFEQRFNSEVQPIPGYLSLDEEATRQVEQKDLSAKGIMQKVIVNSVKLEGNQGTVDADRILHVGQIRSALPFNLSVNLSSTSRNQANPYGLILSKVIALGKKDDSK